MFVKAINSEMLIKMIQMGAKSLSNYKDTINKLNVFPVPDGDTGTNMNLSMQSGVKALKQAESESIPCLLKAYVKGLLMGARGNSGVILSQLFKGFSESLQDREEITGYDFAIALEKGVETAYQAVTNPVEGTILTVAKDVAKQATNSAYTYENIIEVMEEVVGEARASLERTPELLPILKEVGVVDSGGKGLVVIYEGFLAALKGKELPDGNAGFTTEEQVEQEHEKAVQSFVDVESIEFGYCTEFFVELDKTKGVEHPFNEQQFRSKLSEYGDSLLVAATDEVVKIHVHTEYPGKVMSIAQNYGQLMNIDIENMRKQYEAIVDRPKEKLPEEEKEVAIITVALGSGICDMFKSIGATTVIEGGQTMNPSTEDVLQAIENTNANVSYILPNNKNILMAAKQAQELTDRHVVVLPSKSIPQGIGALFAFDETASVEVNEENMLEAMADVKTGLITFATRDTEINHITIKKNHFIAMNDDTIIATDADKGTAVTSLVDELVDTETEIITVFFGEDVTKKEEKALKIYIDTTFDDIEVEYHQGNQPLYSYILMVE